MASVCPQVYDLDVITEHPQVIGDSHWPQVISAVVSAIAPQNNGQWYTHHILTFPAQRLTCLVQLVHYRAIEKKEPVNMTSGSTRGLGLFSNRGSFCDMKGRRLHVMIKVHEKDKTVEWRERTLTIVTDGRPIEVLQRYPSSVDATGMLGPDHGERRVCRRQ